MGIFDGTDDIAAALARLVQSPRVQYGVNQLQRSLPMVSGPFGGSQLPNFGGSQTGAKSRISERRVGQPPGIGNTLGSLVSKLGGQQQDPLMSLYEQLLSQLQAPVNAPTGINTDDLMKQVRAAIDPIYNQRSEAAKNQATRARADVEGMYGALAEDYERLAPQQVEQAAARQEYGSSIPCSSAASRIN